MWGFGSNSNANWFGVFPNGSGNQNFSITGNNFAVCPSSGWPIYDGIASFPHTISGNNNECATGITAGPSASAGVISDNAGPAVVAMSGSSDTIGSGSGSGTASVNGTAITPSSMAAAGAVSGQTGAFSNSVGAAQVNVNMTSFATQYGFNVARTTTTNAGGPAAYIADENQSNAYTIYAAGINNGSAALKIVRTLDPGTDGSHTGVTVAMGIGASNPFADEDVDFDAQVNKTGSDSSWGFSGQTNDESGMPPQSFSATGLEYDIQATGQDLASSAYNPQTANRRFLYLAPKVYGFGTRAASTAYALGAVVHETDAAGVDSVYVATTAGTSSSSTPTWPNSGTVTDGTAVWTYEETVAAEVGQGIWLDNGEDTRTSYGTGLGTNGRYLNAVIDTSLATMMNTSTAAIRIAAGQQIDLSGNGTAAGQNQHTLEYTAAGGLQYTTPSGTAFSVTDAGVPSFKSLIPAADIPIDNSSITVSNGKLAATVGAITASTVIENGTRALVGAPAGALIPTVDIAEYGARCDMRSISFTTTAAQVGTDYTTLAAADSYLAVGEVITTGTDVVAFSTVTSIAGSTKAFNPADPTTYGAGIGATAGAIIGLSTATTAAGTESDTTGQDITSYVNAAIAAGNQNIVSASATANCLVMGTINADKTSNLTLSAPTIASGFSWVLESNGQYGVTHVGASNFTIGGAFTTTNSRLPEGGVLGGYMSYGGFTGGNTVFYDNVSFTGKYRYADAVENEGNGVYWVGNNRFENDLNNAPTHAFVFDGENCAISNNAAGSGFNAYDSNLSGMPVCAQWTNGGINAFNDVASSNTTLQVRGTAGSSTLLLNGINQVKLINSYFQQTDATSATPLIAGVELWNPADRTGVSYSSVDIEGNFENYPYTGHTLLIDGPLATVNLVELTLKNYANTDSGLSIVGAGPSQTAIDFINSDFEPIENPCAYTGDTNCATGTPHPLFDTPSLYTFGGTIGLPQISDAAAFNLFPGGTSAGIRLILNGIITNISPTPPTLTNASTSTPLVVSPTAASCGIGYTANASSGATIQITMTTALPSNCAIPVLNSGAGTVAITAGTGDTAASGQTLSSSTSGQVITATQYASGTFTSKVQ